MRKTIGITIFTLLITISTFGQDKAADLKHLFEIMQSEKMIDGMFDNMIPAITQQARSQIKGEDAQEKFDSYMEFVMTATKEMTKKMINEEMVKIYDKHFTQDEIKELIKFYESSIGKKMIEKTPDLTKDLMEVMMSKYLPEFQKSITEKLEEMKKAEE